MPASAFASQSYTKHLEEVGAMVPGGRGVLGGSNRYLDEEFIAAVPLKAATAAAAAAATAAQSVASAAVAAAESLPRLVVPSPPAPAVPVAAEFFDLTSNPEAAPTTDFEPALRPVNGAVPASELIREQASLPRTAVPMYLAPTPELTPLDDAAVSRRRLALGLAAGSALALGAYLALRNGGQGGQGGGGGGRRMPKGSGAGL